jgi:hypothetical protein
MLIDKASFGIDMAEISKDGERAALHHFQTNSNMKHRLPGLFLSLCNTNFPHLKEPLHSVIS